MDFAKLLGRTALEAKAPALAPAGLKYPGEILDWKADKSRGNPPKPVIKITLKAEDWADNVPEDERTQDITKKRFERDFLIDEEDPNSMYYIDELLRSCNISGNGLSYDELLPQLRGAKVYFDVVKRTYEAKDGNMREAIDVRNIQGR